MRTLSADFKAQKNARENAPVFLYILHEYNGSDNLNYAEAHEDIVFDGVTYTKLAIQHDIVSENGTGRIDSVTLTIANNSGIMHGILATYELMRKKVTIRRVWRDALDHDDAYVDDVYYIERYVETDKAVIFTLSSKWDVNSKQIPSRIYLRNHCAWRFKGSECGYSGGETDCNKTLARCRELSNQIRFGGFPGIPSRRFFV